MSSSDLVREVQNFINEKAPYYSQWIYDEPVVISKAQHEKLSRLHQIMFRLINGFVLNYTKYEYLMPISAKAKEVFEVFKDKPYVPGTYRTDFVYDEKKNVKLIEITCRFALNTQFVSAAIQEKAEIFRRTEYPDLATINKFNGLYAHIEKRRGAGDKIYVLKGIDQKNESRIYADIFRGMNLQVIEVTYDRIAGFLDDFKDSWVVSELTLEEIEDLDLQVVKRLKDCNLINDFRTVLLIHDKRFFAVLGEKQFLKDFLSKDDLRFFQPYYVPTYTYQMRQDLWQNAIMNKDGWILKHRSLGKSKQIYAGVVTSQKEAWFKLL